MLNIRVFIEGGAVKKRILITGCSKQDGVGYQLAQEMIRRGHHVIATVRNLATSDLSLLVPEGSGTLDIKLLDLCDVSSIEALINSLLKQYGGVDVIVNNAANVAIGPVETLSQSDLQTTFQTKVFGAVALIQGFLPAMRAQKKGLLITTSTIFCSLPVTLPGFSAYIASLHAFEALQQCLAVELKPWNIDVVNFQPGPISTNLAKFEGEKASQFAKEYNGYVERVYQWIVDTIPFQTAAELAPIYASVIESNTPHLTVQSSEFCRQYVKANRPDETSMQMLKQWIDRVHGSK